MYNFLLVSFTVLSSAPGISGTESDALDAARRALLATDSVKQTVDYVGDKGKREILNFTGMEEENLIYFIWAVPIVSGKLSTKPFKKLGFHGKAWYVRPEIEYRFSDNDFSSNLNVHWDF